MLDGFLYTKVQARECDCARASALSLLSKGIDPVSSPSKKKRGFVRKRMKGRLLVTGASHSYPTSCSCISSISFIDCMQHKKYSREGDNTARYEGVRNSYIVASASSCGVYIRTCLFHYCLPDALVQVQKLFF